MCENKRQLPVVRPIRRLERVPCHATQKEMPQPAASLVNTLGPLGSASRKAVDIQSTVSHTEARPFNAHTFNMECSMESPMR